MAKGKKTGGKDFKPGHGIGRPALPPEIREASKLTKDEAITKLSEYLKLSINELEVAVKDRTKSAMDLWIARIVLLGIKNGDQVRLDFMFNRLIGKVTDKVEHSLPKPTIIEYPDGGKMVLGYEKE